MGGMKISPLSHPGKMFLAISGTIHCCHPPRKRSFRRPHSKPPLTVSRVDFCVCVRVTSFNDSSLFAYWCTRASRCRAYNLQPSASIRRRPREFTAQEITRHCQFSYLAVRAHCEAGWLEKYVKLSAALSLQLALINTSLAGTMNENNLKCLRVTRKSHLMCVVRAVASNGWRREKCRR